jgi:signal transduction histidine kinase
VVQRFPIKTKAAAVMAVPLAMLFLVAGLEVAQSARRVHEVRVQTDLATAAIGPSGLVTALQNERNYATMWMIGTESIVDLPVDSIDGSRRATDEALAAFSTEVERKGGDVERIYAPALTALRELSTVREQVDGYTGPRVISDDPVVEGSWHHYSRLVTALSDQNSQLTIEVADDDLRLGVGLIDMASREVDRIAQFVRVALLSAVTGDQRLRDRAEILEASPLKEEAVRWHYTIVERANGPYAELGEELREESDATNAIPIVEDIMRTGDVDVAAVLDAISISDDESYYGFVNDVSTLVGARADDLNAAARARQRWYTVGGVGFVLVSAALIGAMVSRSITRPLRSLTRQAIDVAQRRLPSAVRSVLETPRGDEVVVPELEPVRLGSGDEVGDVAEMLNVVQTSALHLAVEQAMLRRNVADAFVSLAKRNQRLLDRQLGFITELESNEVHDGTIANLFRLDHHATRMRRNAESLLVLAGTEPARQWAAPVSLLDVVRAALGEVEDFQRVSYAALAPTAVAGSAVADLAHLLAELIENALRFSPPTESVEVRGRHDGDGYVLDVIDSGFGMGPADITQANRRLAQAEDFTVAPSKYLGHYVAGTLAARHGIAVWCEASAGGGITAAVRLPRPVLAGGDPRARAPGPAPASTVPLGYASAPPRSPAFGTPTVIVPPSRVDPRMRPSVARRSLTRTPDLEVAPPPPPPPAVPAAEPARRSVAERADALYVFLNAFTAGVERGRQAIHPNGHTFP